MKLKHNKLFLLSNLSKHIDYDTYCGFVIDAKDENEARKFAQDLEPKELIWLNEKTSSCVRIGISDNNYGASACILADFKAG